MEKPKLPESALSFAVYAQRSSISLREAMEVFYTYDVYQEMREGISDMHCRSDGYLAEEIERELQV
jgi:hypothetical protein